MHINDAARRVATAFDTLNRLVKHYLPARSGKALYKDRLAGNFCRVLNTYKEDFYVHAPLTAGFYGICPTLSGK